MPIRDASNFTMVPAKNGVQSAAGAQSTFHARDVPSNLDSDQSGGLRGLSLIQFYKSFDSLAKRMPLVGGMGNTKAMAAQAGKGLA